MYNLTRFQFVTIYMYLKGMFYNLKYKFHKIFLQDKFSLSHDYDSMQVSILKWSHICYDNQRIINKYTKHRKYFGISTISSGYLQISHHFVYTPVSPRYLVGNC